MATALNYRCKWIDNYPFLKLSDWPINITAKTVQTKMYPHINKARELQKASPFTAPIRSTSLAIIFVALWYCSLCTASLSQWWSVDQLPLFCSQSVDWLGWVWLHHIYLFYFHVSTFLGFVQYQPGGILQWTIKCYVVLLWKTQQRASCVLTSAITSEHYSIH